jgi:hypothetical protein
MAEFQLEVTFTGLNLFVVHADGQHVGVLQPDARPIGDDHMQHPDGSDGVPHAGYLRFDLANLGIPVPPGDKPQGEGVYRFANQTLQFGLGSDPVQVIDTATKRFPLPDFRKFAPDLVVRPDLFSGTPAAPPVMWSVLSGGVLEGTLGGGEFAMPQVLNKNPARYKLEFASDVTWKRPVSDAELKLTLHDFSTGVKQAEIPLKPVAGAPIKLKIANLCSENPLEWDEFLFNAVGKDDEDFKWLYRLLLPKSGTYEDNLLGSALPIPRLMRAGGPGVENCIGGIIHGQTFPLPVRTSEG